MDVMKRYLTEDEQRRLFAILGQSAGALARRDRAWILLLHSTGMRIGEFCLMTVGDAKSALHTGYVFIPKERRKGKKRDHSVLATQPVREQLATLLDMRVGADDAAPLIVSQKGGRMSVRGYQQRLARWAAKAGIDGGVSPHWLRHTRAMNIMRRSQAADPRGVAQAALGHTSITTTGIYTRVTKEDVESALNQVDGKPRLPKRKLRGHFEARSANHV